MVQKELNNPSVIFIDGVISHKEVNELYSLAETNELTIVATLQLPRLVEKRNDKCPIASDVKSLSLLKDKISVFGLYRDEVYNPNSENEGLLEISSLFHPSLPKAKLYIDISKQKITS